MTRPVPGPLSPYPSSRAALARLEALSFVELIEHCCVTPELTLRRTIVRALRAAGFRLHRDAYTSPRARTAREARKHCNLLFVRGEPAVALVAHTDVCRDHEALERGEVAPIPRPVLALRKGRRILVDRSRSTQLGGDDRLGVAIALWFALHTERALGLLLTSDEELGLFSARACSFPRLQDFRLLVQIDRGNASRQLVDRIRGQQLCTPETRELILAALRADGTLLQRVDGGGTDVYALVSKGACKEAINLTCGYHESYGDSGEEYIDLEEARDTVRTVETILDAIEGRPAQELVRVRRPMP